MCTSDGGRLNQLYTRKFSKIPIFDEEEDCTVEPEKENGYVFSLDLEKFYQYLQDGDAMFTVEGGSKNSSKVEVQGPPDSEVANLLQVFPLDEEARQREFTFTGIEQDEVVPGGHVLDQESVENLFHGVKMCLYK